LRITNQKKGRKDLSTKEIIKESIKWYNSFPSKEVKKGIKADIFNSVPSANAVKQFKENKGIFNDDPNSFSSRLFMYFFDKNR
jgi:hypothetical protein